MENLLYKLNKYTIKLQKFINNNELIENNFDKYLLYLNKFKYYYNLTGGGKKKRGPKTTPTPAEKEAKKISDDQKRAARAAKAREDITVSVDSEAVFGETPTKSTKSKAQTRSERRAEEKRKHDAGNATGKPSNAGEDGQIIQVINTEGKSSIARKSHSHSGSSHGNIPKDIMENLRSICKSIHDHDSNV